MPRLEEERRLAYVGLTRARERAIVFFAANRRIYGSWQSSMPSRFINELPGDNIEMESASGLYERSNVAFAGLDEVGIASQSMEWKARPRNRAGGSTEVSWSPPEHKIFDGGFRIGERIFHQKFGYGRIMSIEGEKLDIAFDKAGNKKVMMSFVEAL